MAPCPAGQRVQLPRPPQPRGHAHPAVALTLWKAEETMWWISEDTGEWVMVLARAPARLP